MLEDKKIVSENLALPGGALEYKLVMSSENGEVGASLNNNSITINLPITKAVEWISNEEVGIYASIVVDGSYSLNISIEKDFPCKTRPDEDKADTFAELAEKLQPDNCWRTFHVIYIRISDHLAKSR